jgi:hypothetical protein
MSIDRLSVPARKPPRCDEPHHTGMVEQQDGSALASQNPEDRIQSRLVDVLGRFGLLQPLGELIERGLLLQPASKRCFRPLAVRDVVLDAHRVKKPPLDIAHG